MVIAKQPTRRNNLMSLTIPQIELPFQLSLFKTSTLETLSSENLSYPVDVKLKQFMALSSAIFQKLGTKPHSLMAVNRTGRPALPYDAMFLASLARCFYGIDTVKHLVGFLGTNGGLREYCGFSRVPSEATFSRFLATVSSSMDMNDVIGCLASGFYGDSLVGNICRDSTTMAANDKAVKTVGQVAKSTVKKKRGRKKKGSLESLEYLKEQQEKEANDPINRQTSQTPEESIALLNRNCAFGAKTNAKGVPEYAKGYKAHIDVTDNGVPTAFVITGANVHDSRVSIPLEQLTGRCVTSLYTLSDSGYYSTKIDSFIRLQGKVPLTDPAKRRNSVPFAPHEALHFKARTTVERTNSQLKLYYLPQIFTHGYSKFKFVVGMALALISVIQISRIAAARQA
ncbi:MAG: transposase [Sphaerochaetaceae bacterium]